MTYEICATQIKERVPIVLRTDDPGRAAVLAKVLNANQHYADVTVIIGHQRFNYSDFIKQLEKTT